MHDEARMNTLKLLNKKLFMSLNSLDDEALRDLIRSFSATEVIPKLIANEILWDRMAEQARESENRYHQNLRSGEVK